MSILPLPIQPSITLSESLRFTPCQGDRGVHPQLSKETKVNNQEAVNQFLFKNAQLKSVKDYGNIIKGIVQSRQTYQTPDGQLKSKFVASRQVTIADESLITFLRPLLATQDEFIVDISGYMTTTVREREGKSTWYDNQMVTELEILA